MKMKINNAEIGRKVMANMNLTVRFDMDEIRRGAYGLFRWRLRLGMALVWAAKVLGRLASFVMRCGYSCDG